MLLTTILGMKMKEKEEMHVAVGSETNREFGAHRVPFKKK